MHYGKILVSVSRFLALWYKSSFTRQHCMLISSYLAKGPHESFRSGLPFDVETIFENVAFYGPKKGLHFGISFGHIFISTSTSVTNNNDQWN